MSLVAGYAATSTEAFTVTGTPAPTVTKTSGNAAITWNNATNKLDIAAGLPAGTYPVVLTVTSGANTVTHTFTLAVAPTGAPVITGPTTMSLAVGYAATSTEAFTITGTPAPTVAKTSGNAAITWNGVTNKLDIAAGLAAGTYPVVLTATSGANTATLTFTLTVTSGSTPPGTGGMANFVRSRTYTPGQFTDVNENEWYGYNQRKSIADAYEYGLVQGVTLTTFVPSANITVAELIVLAVNVRLIYEGDPPLVMGDPWYMVFVDYAISKGMIGANDFTAADYTRAASRGEMAYIFSRCLPAAEYPSLNTVNSLPDVGPATPYRDEIFALYRAGVMSGNDSAGTFLPGNKMTRAEAAAIISFVILPNTRTSGRVYG